MVADHSPGAVRLTYVDRHLPNPPLSVPGTGLEFILDDVRPSGGRPVAVLKVVAGPPPGRLTEIRLVAGQSAAVGKETVRAAHVHDMPDPANDAVDVQVRPAA